MIMKMGTYLRSLLILVLLVLLLLAVRTFYYQLTTLDVSSVDARVAAQSKLMDGYCPTAEALVREHLQQSWFWDPEFNRLAGAFGRTGFTLYRNDEAIEGAYCISGRQLMIRYYDNVVLTTFGKRDNGSWGVVLRTRIKPLHSDIFHVTELSAKSMTFNSDSEQQDYVFYRKN